MKAFVGIVAIVVAVASLAVAQHLLRGAPSQPYVLVALEQVRIYPGGLNRVQLHVHAPLGHWTYRLSAVAAGKPKAIRSAIVRTDGSGDWAGAVVLPEGSCGRPVAVSLERRDRAIAGVDIAAAQVPCR